MNNFKKYASYKDSEIEWASHIPSHWEVLKLKHIFLEKKIKHNPSLNCGSISYGEVVYKNDESVPESTKASYQEVLVGEFLINPLNLNYDLKSLRIALSDLNVLVSSGYIVLKNHLEIDKRYYKYLLHIYDIAYMKLLGSGVRQTINFNHISSSLLAYPPLPEQTAIANFLDKKTAEIKEFIALKEKTIELLKERAFKLAINGLEESKEIEEWEDNFPFNWQVLKGKWIFKEVKIKNKPSEELLAVTQNRGVLPKSMCDENFVTPDEKGLLSQKLVPKQSFVISLRSFQGGIEFSYYQGIVSPAYTVFVLKEEYDDEKIRVFYKYFFKSLPFIELLNTIISGIRDGQNISFTDFSRLCIPIPDEATIDAIFELDKIILSEEIQTKKEIELIKEYQQSLISEVVTGKVDVRGLNN